MRGGLCLTLLGRGLLCDPGVEILDLGFLGSEVDSEGRLGLVVSRGVGGALLVGGESGQVGLLRAGFVARDTHGLQLVALLDLEAAELIDQRPIVGDCRHYGVSFQGC